MVTSKQELTLTEKELFDRIRWSVRLRWGVSIAANIALIIAWFLFGIRFPLPDTILIGLAIPLYNAVFAYLTSSLQTHETITTRRISRLASAQVICDTVAVASLIHFTGGVENPFLIFVIFPIVYTTPLLPRKTVFFYTTIAAFLMNAVFWGEAIGLLDHVPFPHVGGETLYREPLHVIMISGSLTVTLYLVFLLGGTIASRLRYRERELEGAYRQLKELNDARTFYVRKVSHELKAPLSAMRSLLGVILQGLMGELSDTHKETLNRVDRRAEGLLSLVSDLLTFARLETADRPVKQEIFDVGELVHAVVAVYQTLAAEKNLQLEVSAELCPVCGNKEDIEQLVTNLVSNGLRYTPSGGCVDVNGNRVNGIYSLEVRDTGIGIPKDRVPHVFDEFFRASNARQTVPEGTGMGLAIVKRITEMHGGTVRVESVEGTGTTFTVVLPVHEGGIESAERNCFDPGTI